MPTFKHPCATCGRYIARDVARCPFCGTIDPFVPGRCAACRTPIEDPAWVACPSCGAPLKEGVAPMPGATPEPAAAADAPSAGSAPPPSPPAAATSTTTLAAATSPGPEPTPAPAAASSCSACGTGLAPGARFCTVCGTLAG